MNVTQNWKHKTQGEKTLRPKDLSQGSLQNSSHTKLAPHSHHAKVTAVIIWMTI